jgi:hypothetical protein
MDQYDRPNRGNRFHLEITSIEELAAFVALVRGEADLSQIAGLLGPFKAATERLRTADEANRADQASPPPSA